MNRIVKLSIILTLITVIILSSINSFGKEKTFISSFSKIDTIGSSITFSENDFDDAINGKDKLDEILICELPMHGILSLNEVELNEGQYIDYKDIKELKYDSTVNECVEDSFSFVPVFEKSGSGDEPIRIKLSLTDQRGNTPVAVNANFKTYMGIAVNGKLNAFDADNDAVCFEITKNPTKGKVSVNGNIFKYEPKSGKSGKDYFEFKAIDSKGNASDIARINLEIVKQSSLTLFLYIPSTD